MRDPRPTRMRCEAPDCDWIAESHFVTALEAEYLQHLRDVHVEVSRNA